MRLLGLVELATLLIPKAFASIKHARTGRKEVHYRHCKEVNIAPSTSVPEHTV